MSEFSTLFSLEKKTKVLAFITAKQAQMLLFYFKSETLLPYLRIIEINYPNYYQFGWIDPFPK